MNVIRTLCALTLAGLLATSAQAHFLFIVPAKEGTAATVVFSDDLNPDDAVDLGKVAGLKLTVRDVAGQDVSVAHKMDKSALAATLPGSGPRVIFGSIEYGVMQRGDSKPFLLVYHPKALVGTVTAEKQSVSDKLLAELLPITAEGKVRFKLLAAGKPIADAEVTIIKPDGSRTKAKTGDDGFTEALEGAGRYGVWARYSEAKSGERVGKKFEEIRHYPSLVVDVAGK